MALHDIIVCSLLVSSSFGLSSDWCQAIKTPPSVQVDQAFFRDVIQCCCNDTCNEVLHVTNQEGLLTEVSVVPQREDGQRATPMNDTVFGWKLYDVEGCLENNGSILATVTLSTGWKSTAIMLQAGRNNVVFVLHLFKAWDIYTEEVVFQERNMGTWSLYVENKWGRNIDTSVIPYFPFLDDTPFELQFTSHGGRVQVYVDSVQYADYTPTMAVSEIIEIQFYNKDSKGTINYLEIRH